MWNNVDNNRKNEKEAHSAIITRHTEHDIMRLKKIFQAKVNGNHDNDVVHLIDDLHYLTISMT